MITGLITVFHFHGRRDEHMDPHVITGGCFFVEEPWPAIFGHFAHLRLAPLRFDAFRCMGLWDFRAAPSRASAVSRCQRRRRQACVFAVVAVIVKTDPLPVPIRSATAFCHVPLRGRRSRRSRVSFFSACVKESGVMGACGVFVQSLRVAAENRWLVKRQT